MSGKNPVQEPAPVGLDEKTHSGSLRVILIVLAYLTICVVWGSTYFFIKLAVASIHPFAVLAIRFVIGGMMLLAMAAFMGKLKSFPKIRELLGSLLLGMLLLFGGNGLITLSEMRSDSSFVSLMVAATPMLVAFFERLLFRRRIPLVRFLGILAGFAGVIFLVYKGESVENTLTPSVLAALGGALSFSFGMSLRPRLPLPRDSVVNTAVQMTGVGIASLLVAIYTVPDLDIMLASATPVSWGSLAFLAVVGSLVFVVFNFLLREEPGSRVASYSLVNPVIAVFLGICIGGESPAQNFFISLPLILAGVGIMLYGEKLVQLFRVHVWHRIFPQKEE